VCFRRISCRQISQAKQMADVTVAMVTSDSRLFEPDEAVRGKAFVFIGAGGGRGKGKVGWRCEPKWQEE
jgi:hypothetical protein